MKIAIVCGHFVPNLGYLEVHLANTYHRMGHEIKVITSDKTSSSANYLSSNQIKKKLPFKVKRLKAFFSYGQIVMAKGISEEILSFNPNKVIVFGLGKIFPKETFKIKNRKFELITLLGDNEDTYDKNSNNLKRIILQKILKTPIYNLAIKNSDKLIGSTPSTLKSIETFISANTRRILQQKYSIFTLGFDESEFYFSERDRLEMRKKIGIKNDEIVLITATRVTPAKKIEKVIDAIEILSKKGLKFKYVFIGFSEKEYCNQLKDYIKSKQLSDILITLPFTPRVEMNRYYNMADIGLWTQAAISIFEGLATGLFILLPSKENVSHILSEHSGVYYSNDNFINQLENSILNYKSKKEANAIQAKKLFSFDIIAKKIIAN